MNTSNTADAERSSTTQPIHDPLRLCIYATIALIGWLAGPFGALAFAALALAGYVKALRAGLTRSKCALRDTRLVLTFLALIAIAATIAIALRISGWVH